MKRVYCIDCKWATSRWNYTGHIFCKGTITQSWSWAQGRAVQHAERCVTLNTAGRCDRYKPRLRKRFWNWVYAVTWNVRKRG